MQICNRSKKSDFAHTSSNWHSDSYQQVNHSHLAETTNLLRHTFLDKIIKSWYEWLNFRRRKSRFRDERDSKTGFSPQCLCSSSSLKACGWASRTALTTLQMNSGKQSNPHREVTLSRKVTKASIVTLFSWFLSSSASSRKFNMEVFGKTAQSLSHHGAWFSS